MKGGSSTRHTKGFTLMETLITLLIVGVAFAGLSSLQSACLHGIDNAYHLTTAAILAQDKMETLKNLHHNHADLSDTKPGNNEKLWQCADPASSDHYEGTITVREQERQLLPPGIYAGYARCWNIADNTPFAGKKTVVVIVTRKAIGKRVALSSVL